MTSKITALSLNSKIENTKSKKVNELKIEPDIDFKNIQIHRGVNYKERMKETKATTEGNVVTQGNIYTETKDNLIKATEENIKDNLRVDEEIKPINPPKETLKINNNYRLETLGRDSNSSSSDEKLINNKNEIQNKEIKEENSSERDSSSENELIHSHRTASAKENHRIMIRDQQGNCSFQQSKECLICNKLYLFFDLFSGNKCSHFICKKCLKRFFEEKIEEGNFCYKCPIFFCTAKYDKETIRLLVTTQHFNAIDGKLSAIAEMKNDIETDSNIKTPESTMTHMKYYSQKYVVDIGENQQFFYFNKYKYFLCQNCNEMALFGKSDGHFVKCLNCFYCICKHCLLKFEDGHMDISKNNHCKVYFRIEEEEDNKNKKGIIKIYLETLLFSIIAYLALFCGIFCYLERFFFYVITCGVRKREKYISINIISYFIIILVFLCFFPFLIILFPFYPIFISIFG